MREASFLYAELVGMGAAMRFIDCGGGLAVDYDGSFTDSAASMSYTLQHYANDGAPPRRAGFGRARDSRPGSLCAPASLPPRRHPTRARPRPPLPPAVVSAVQEVCIQRGISPPTIVTESGRALASHHSVLVFDVLTTCAAARPPTCLRGSGCCQGLLRAGGPAGAPRPPRPACPIPVFR